MILNLKEYIILITVLMLVFIPNVSFNHYLEKSGKEVINIAKELEMNLEKGNVNKSDADRLKESFLEKEKIWILLVDHDMLDEIEYKVEDCVAHYSIEDKAEFISSAYQLYDEIEDLSKREEISFGNIL